MNEISDQLSEHGHFHDWYLEAIIIRGTANRRVPDTLVLGLFESEREATITFSGVTRLGIEDGGALNIVNAIEVVESNSQAFQQAQSLLAKSAHDKRKGNYTVYLYSTVGAEIAVEFDSMNIDLKRPIEVGKLR
ncbi:MULTISPECIES: hypothetical protein [unclassified Caballeronia]|uniref:hypothetical protein n=1 Tax=unclassified Caballeronia TaxID=2646786 RepID=UPI0028653BC4|nr:MULTISPECIES: hypothetical protein [unclassified Caballeronia]MDR5754292.1 hypothetical protein [Caballeronia sp. LZ024]MDR5840670.1 hypothetical protein [Caballeronia sp. LZ031]